MKNLPKLTALVCALALAVPVVPAAHAGEGVNSSEASVLMTSSLVSMVVAAPFVLVSEGAEKLANASAGSNRQSSGKSRRSADDTLPEMEVKEVGADENGDPRVHLQVPDTPEHTVTLTWPQREDSPAAGFREGQRIAFQPSPQASGWLLRDDTGTTLGFIPVADSAAEQHSALF